MLCMRHRSSVTLVTNGKEPSVEIPSEIKVITTEIAKIAGEDKVEAIEFKDGASLAVSGMFVAYGVAGSAELAQKLGAATEGNRIVVDENMATNIPGLYAAGDCIGGLLQISKAVSDGAKAGTSMVKYLRK